jgi:hypothetical protein
MPVLNARGDVAHGIGGGNLCINNVAIRKGFVLGWVDDDTVAFCDGADERWLVSTYHVPTNVVTPLPQGVSANRGACGGGRIAWWLGSQDGTRGLWSTTGFRAPLADLLGVGPDGSIAYRLDYHGAGPSVVRDIDGSDFLLTLGAADSVSLQGQRRVLWLEDGRLKVVNLPPVRCLEGRLWLAQAAVCGNEWWVVYISEHQGVVLHPFASLTGFAAAPTGDAWPSGDAWPTIRALDDRILRIAMSRTQGEQAGDIWVRDCDVVANAVRDPWGANTWTPVQRVNLETVTAPPPTLPRFTHPMRVGYFYRDTSAIQYGGDNPAAPCNVSVIIDPLALPAEDYDGTPVGMITSVACLTDLAIHPEWWVRWDAIYLPAEGDAALLERLAAAVRRFAADLGLPPRPFLSYTAGWTFPNALTPTDIIGVQLYMAGAQGPADLRAMAASVLPPVAHRRVALICQAYDRAGLYTGDLAALQPVYAEIAERWRNVEYLLWFSDGRTGGTRDHEEIRRWHLATLKACG